MYITICNVRAKRGMWMVGPLSMPPYIRGVAWTDSSCCACLLLFLPVKAKWPRLSQVKRLSRGSPLRSHRGNVRTHPVHNRLAHARYGLGVSAGVDLPIDLVASSRFDLRTKSVVVLLCSSCCPRGVDWRRVAGDLRH